MIQFVLLIILPLLVIVTIIRSEQILNRLRKTVRKSEAEYSSVVESTSDAISIMDRSGTYLFMNTRYRDRLGISGDGGKGRSYRIFHDPDRSVAVLADIDRVFTSGSLLTREWQENGWSLLQVLNPVIDPGSGAVIAVTEILRDITDQKKTEKALSENEKRYRLLLLNANDTVILFEPAGDHTGRITEVNAMATTMFGYTGDELISMNLRDFGVLKSEEPYRHVYEELLTTSHAVFETEIPTKSGHLLPVEVSVRLFTSQDKPTGLASIRDISQRKAAEQSMQQSLAEKQLLLKEIHHRVKNNLQVIISLLNLQSRYLTDPAILLVIAESQHRVKAMALVHEQLYQTRRFAGINFRNYVQSLTSNLLSSFSKPAQKIALEIAIPEDTWINLDAALPLGLIISELVTNSFKYAFPGPRTGKIGISLVTENGKYILMVRDDGIGIAQDFAWDQAKSLGLRLVRMLTRQIDGTITRIPEEGMGFRIEFVPKDGGLDDGTGQDPYR